MHNAASDYSHFNVLAAVPPPFPAQLLTCLKRRQLRYRTTIEEDEAIIADPSHGPRPTVAARLLKGEKRILLAAQAAVMELPGASDAEARGPMPSAIAME